MFVICTVLILCILLLFSYTLILHKQLKSFKIALRNNSDKIIFNINEPVQNKKNILGIQSLNHNISEEIIKTFEKSIHDTVSITPEKLSEDFDHDFETDEISSNRLKELDRFPFVAIDCICVLDIQGFFKCINKQWQLLFGYNDIYFPGKSLFSFVHEDDLIATKEFILSLERHSEIVTFINRCRASDNSYKWLEWRLIRLGNQIYAAARDITERKRNEETFRDLVEVTVKTPSKGFFNSISDWLKNWLNADICLICEINENSKFKTVAISCNPDICTQINNSENEPLIELTIQMGFCYYSDNIDAICPGSPLIRNNKARGYAGISLYDKNGNTKGVICIFSKSNLILPSLSHEVFQIIAVRTSGELEQLQSEAIYSSILNTAMDCFALLDNFGKFIDVNEAYCRLTGYNKQELSSMSIADIDVNDNGEYIIKRLDTLRKKVHDRFETQHRIIDGRLIDIEISINYLAIDSGRFFMFLRDITERKKTESDIRDITERFTLATKAASMGIWDWDIDKDALVWNDQMFLLYGIEREKITSFALWRKSIHPDDVERTMVEIGFALKGIKEFDTEFRIILPDKGVKYVRVISKVYRDKYGKAIRLIGTNWDITAEKETQREFRKAIDEADRANSSKSEFIANMSHEIRTPLNVVIGFSELLESLSTDNRQKQYINSIITAGRSLLRIINDILDMSKIESGMMKVQFAPMELQTIFDEIEQIFNPRIKEKGLKLKLHIDPDLPEVLYLDEIRLRQVILNLVGNAVKFTDSGYIKISTKPLKDFNIDAQSLDLSIEIEDTGIGIPEDEQSIIFEPFRQRTGQNNAKYGGTGLGLSISRKLTELMNGELSVKSKPEKGTVFILKLYSVKFIPVTNAIQKCSFSNTNQSITFNKATVLIADDIESNRIVIREHLIKVGLDVIETDNGFDAARIALEKKPDVIIMDIRMPKMNGIEAMKQIRATASIKDTPIIALSAASNINEIECEGQISFSLCLCKPIERERLINALLKFIPQDDKKLSRKCNNMEKSEISPEIKLHFKNDFLSKLNSFNGAIRTQSLRSLIGELHLFSLEHKSKELSSLALKLERAVEAFDIEKIKLTLKKLNDLCT